MIFTLPSTGFYDLIDNEIYFGDLLRDNKGLIYEVKCIKGYYILEDTKNRKSHTNLDSIKLGNKIEAIKILNS